MALSPANSPGHRFPQASWTWEHPPASPRINPAGSRLRVKECKAHLGLGPWRPGRVAGVWPWPCAHGRETLSTTRSAGTKPCKHIKNTSNTSKTHKKHIKHTSNTSLPWCPSPSRAGRDRDSSPRCVCLSLPVPAHSRSCLVLPPAGGQSPELSPAQGLSPAPLKAFAGTAGSAESFPKSHVFPSHLGFFSLTAAPGLAFIHEYCSSEHSGNIPDCRAALGRAMEQQSPRKGTGAASIGCFCVVLGGASAALSLQGNPGRNSKGKLLNTTGLTGPTQLGSRHKNIPRDPAQPREGSISLCMALKSPQETHPGLCTRGKPPRTCQEWSPAGYPGSALTLGVQNWSFRSQGQRLGLHP